MRCIEVNSHRTTTMADEGVFGDIVTKFFLNTCRLRPQLSEYTVQAVMHCAITATAQPANDAEADLIPLIAGSVAEFYIEPMLPHVGDIDVMAHDSTILAIPRGHPRPTQLPAEFRNYVRVCEIVDSHFPGYVYLELCYLLTQCVDDNDYYCSEYDNNRCLQNFLYGDHEIRTHGPALLSVSRNTEILSVDNVYCVRCLSWPPQAADWPTRQRIYNWLDSATVGRIVSSGCDVVPMAHSQCRQDERMRKLQWRLSFSRAEIVLTNS